ncbi:MAG: molecular chaperone TorD family protein [Candidatus Eisenbacteria bacterium]
MTGGAPGKPDTSARSTAADRAAAFLFVHDLFRLPSAGQWAWIGRDETRRPWAALAEALGLPGPDEISLPSEERRYESEFISAFEAGAPTPAVPLMESHYSRRGPTGLILQENVLFYRRFGLRLKNGTTENADHLRSQLEFVAHLYRLESHELSASGSEERLGSIRRARGEFVDRHLLGWLPAAESRAAGAAPPWAAAYIALARRLVDGMAEDPRPTSD